MLACLKGLRQGLGMTTPSIPPQPKLGQLKSLAQKLDPTVVLGKTGLSEAFVQELNGQLLSRQLVKVRLAYWLLPAR